MVVLPTPWVKFLFWIYILFLTWASATVTNPADPDLWHRLAVGEYLWQTHHFPAGDTFSYLSDYPRVADHEWGSALIFYFLWQGGGGTAMVLAKIATLTVTMALLMRAGIDDWRPTAWITAFYALVILALLPSFQSTLRCMAFTHVIFALWLFWFQQERRGRSVPTILYILTMILWANLHGGFVIGLGWLFLVTVLDYFYGGPWQKGALRLALCAGATLINPFGWQLWISTIRALTTTRQGFNEWGPVSWIASPGSYPGYKLLLISVIVAFAVQVRRKGWKCVDQPGAILVGFFMLLSFVSARHTSLLAVVSGALVPCLFPLRWPHVLSLGPVRRLVVMAMNSTLLMVPFFTALIVLPGAKLTLEYPRVACPVDAVNFLRDQGTSGNLLVSFNYGSNALWELRGKMRVSMDGRYDLVYKPQTYRRVDDFFEARGDWKSLLTVPPPAAILVRRDDNVYRKLRNEAAWTEAWHDPIDAVFLPVK